MKSQFQFASQLFLWVAAISLMTPREIEARVTYVGASEAIKSIKYALSQANPFDTIIVRDGVYVEDIKVRLPVLLMAENKHQAVIGDGSDQKANISVRQNEVDGAIIDGFRFAPGDWHGIRIGDVNGDFMVANTEVRNCLIEGRVKGIFVTNMVHHVRIKGNVIRGCSQEGILYSGNGQTIISGNTIYDGEAPGIMITQMGDDSPVIINNTITGNREGGIVLERSGIVLEGNLISGNRFGIGTNTACDGLVIRNSNKVVDNLEHGIQIESHIQVTVKENEVRGNGGSGIICRGDVVIQGNAITQNGEMGVWGQGGSIHIEDNDIEQNFIHGVEIANELDDVRIIGNRISGNLAHGLMLGDESMVKGNVFRENQETGILITDIAKNVVVSDGNILAGNKWCQIQVDHGGEAQILGNDIYGDSTRALTEEGPGGLTLMGSALVEGNTIRHIHSPGVNIEENAGEVIVRGGNVIEDCYRGIIVRVPARITGNEIHNCERAAIIVSDSASGSVIGWNRMTGNGLGVFCASEIHDLEISWNFISENLEGIRLAGTAVLRSNTIIHNEGAGLNVRAAGTDLGRLHPPDSGNNAIFGNGYWNVWNQVPDTLWAPYNYWDTDISDSIDASIMDDDEDPAQGPVIFLPCIGDFNVGKEKDPIPGAGSGPVITAWPNPFRDEVKLSFPAVPHKLSEIQIVDLWGRLIHSSGTLPYLTPGYATYHWNGMGPDQHQLPPGLYLAVFIQDGKAVNASSLILVKQ